MLDQYQVIDVLARSGIKVFRPRVKSRVDLVLEYVEGETLRERLEREVGWALIVLLVSLMLAWGLTQMAKPSAPRVEAPVR